METGEKDLKKNGAIASLSFGSERKFAFKHKETKEKVDYVYHPNQKTGDYLVILPPNKSYDMIIESEGFHPYTLNIDVPNQTEFYELYQKIYLKTIKHFDVVVGQEIQVIGNPGQLLHGIQDGGGF